MNVAELFVKLGVSGNEKAEGAINDVTDGLKGAKSMSLEAKAGILGALYALEQLFSAAGTTGTNLTNMNARLGISTDLLQRYQYAARQAGATNEETAGTFEAIQQAMTQAALGKNVPTFAFSQLARLTGQITQADVKRWSSHPEELIQRAQQYAKLEKDPGLRERVLTDLHMSTGVRAGIDRGVFTPENLAKAPVLKDNELKNLDKANIALSNLYQKIEMAMAKFAAGHGVKMVGDIAKITDSVLDLVNALIKLADKLQLFTLLGKSLEATAKLVGVLAVAAGDTTGTHKQGDNKELFGKGTFLEKLFNDRDKVDKDFSSGKAQESIMGFFKGLFGPETPGAVGPINPTIAPSPISSPSPTTPTTSNNNKTNVINMNQNLNFSGNGSDHREVSKAARDGTKTGINQAIFQSPALSQGS